MTAVPSTADLVTVRIVGLPLKLYRRAAEHHDELRREFMLIHRSGADEASVPARLQRLGDELDRRFSGFTAQPTGVLRDAVARGDENIDLVYQVPPEAKKACLELDQLLDEADAYCRGGDHLLTLTTPPEPLAFRRWFLSEFANQVDGAEATSWEDYSSTSRA